jgi:hypothetical protein
MARQSSFRNRGGGIQFRVRSRSVRRDRRASSGLSGYARHTSIVSADDRIEIAAVKRSDNATKF